jgi:hypothetical protein
MYKIVISTSQEKKNHAHHKKEIFVSGNKRYVFFPTKRMNIKYGKNATLLNVAAGGPYC